MNDVIDDYLAEKPRLRRRELLPTWIKVFTWIFLVVGALVPIKMIGGLLGYYYKVSIYGISGYGDLSFPDLLVNALFILKGAAAYGLWTEKAWAISVAKVDAVIGLVICTLIMLGFMVFSEEYRVSSLRLELIPLALYFSALHNLNRPWLEAREIGWSSTE